MSSGLGNTGRADGLCVHGGNDDKNVKICGDLKPIKTGIVPHILVYLQGLHLHKILQAQKVRSVQVGAFGDYYLVNSIVSKL